MEHEQHAAHGERAEDGAGQGPQGAGHRTLDGQQQQQAGSAPEGQPVRQPPLAEVDEHEGDDERRGHQVHDQPALSPHQVGDGDEDDTGDGQAAVEPGLPGVGDRVAHVDWTAGPASL